MVIHLAQFSVIIINKVIYLFSNTMNKIKIDAPLKTLIKDLGSFKKSGKSWMYTLDDNNILINISKITLQGEIIKTAGFSNDILILDDGTGKVKVTKASQVPGDLSWVNTGMHCSIVGTLLENGKLPSLAADKIARITNQILQEMWPLEVQELRNVIADKIYPRLPKDCFLNSLETSQ